MLRKLRLRQKYGFLIKKLVHKKKEIQSQYFFLAKWIFCGKPAVVSSKVLGNAFNRNSLLEVFCKKGALRNFAKFTGKHLCQSLLFNKVADVSPVNFAKFVRTPFSQNSSGGCFCIKQWHFRGVFRFQTTSDVELL